MTGFYIALGAAAALVALGVWLAPTAQLHYHSWRFRTIRDPEGKSLTWVARYAANRHMDAATIKRLLGTPDHESPDCIMYKVKMTGAFVPVLGYEIQIENGKAQKAEPEVLHH